MPYHCFKAELEDGKDILYEVGYFIRVFIDWLLASIVRSALIFEDRIVTTAEYVLCSSALNCVYGRHWKVNRDLCMMKITGLYCIITLWAV